MKNYFKVFIILCVFVFAIYSLLKKDHKSIEAKYVEETTDPIYKYGILVDTFNVAEEIVNEGQTLGEILYFNHIDHPQIAEIVNKSKGIFDVRRVNSGQKYTLINSNDSLSELCYFIYEENATDYIVFDFINGINIYRGKKKVKTKLKISQGTINSSLSETIDKLGISPRVSIKLSEIYAWTIDFFKIQEGDAFKVYYENNYIDGINLSGSKKTHISLNLKSKVMH